MVAGGCGGTVVAAVPGMRMGVDVVGESVSVASGFDVVEGRSLVWGSDVVVEVVV